MKIGYARVSTEEQNLNRQLDMLNEVGCEKNFEEKISGIKKERPELFRMLEQLRKGDLIIVADLTRLSRSVKDLFQLVEQIKAIGADIKSLKESWMDTSTPQGKLMFTIFAGISQFERDLISQRTIEGLIAARARGRKGGRPKSDEKALNKAIKLYQSKEYSIKEIVSMTGISQSTIYRNIK